MAHIKKKRIYLADLGYFNNYSLPMLSIPLNIGYIASYILKFFNTEVDITLFKDPRELLLASSMNPPDVLGLSCYHWNMYLDILIASRIKQMNSKCIVVIGGPHIDNDLEEQLDLYLSFKGYLDFMVLNEGELGFHNIIERLLSNGRDKLFRDSVDGCTFFVEGNKPVYGKDIGLSLDLETLPSPILSGLLDNFLAPKYFPMIQTSRMCPYSSAFCCAGKLRGKLRIFPYTVVKNEIEYIAKKYKDNPHRLLYITDLNFGIHERDSAIAEDLVNAKDKIGYPQQTLCYFDKKLSSTVKKSVLLFGDMNLGGLQLATQSFNEKSLKAAKRKNMSVDDLKKAVNWAHKHGLNIFSELIFGLPYETKQSFMDSLEFIMKIKVDLIVVYNLFLLKGIELNRAKERKRFKLSTKFRPSSASAYDIIDNEFVCESEEVVVSSSHFTFKDFMDIRKVSLLFYTINAMGYFKKVVDYLIEQEQKVIPLLESIMNPSEEYIDITGYLNFVDDFVRDANSELFDGHEDISAHLKEQFVNNGNKVGAPIQLNISYGSRLIYEEDWFSKIILKYLITKDIDCKQLTILQDLIAISENEWIDIKHPDRGKTVIVSGDTVAYLNIPSSKPKTAKYNLKMISSEQQLNKIELYNKQYMANDKSYYYNIFNIIHPRKQLKYECVEVESLVE